MQVDDHKMITANRCSATFDVPLFRVNGSIAREASEVFFETNRIHVQSTHLLSLLRRHGRSLRQLHIEHRIPDAGSVLTEHFEALETLTSYANLAPRLRFITLECTGLDLTVRQLVAHLSKMHYGELLELNIDDLRCVDVGLYVLPVPKTSQEWRFSYSLLAELWDLWVREEPKILPSFRDTEDYFSSAGPARLPPWIFGTAQSRAAAMELHNLRGFGTVINRYNAIETMLPMLKPQSSHIDVLRRFELIGGWKTKEAVRHSCFELAGCIDLGDVRTCHGADVLEWATELLAPNVKDYAAEFGHTIEEARDYIRRCQI